MKTQMNVSIENEIAEEAKIKLKGQISNICELALRKALGQSINEEEPECFRCGVKGEEIIWDGFSEYWVCEKCNNSEVKKVSIMAKI